MFYFNNTVLVIAILGILISIYHLFISKVSYIEDSSTKNSKTGKQLNGLNILLYKYVNSKRKFKIIPLLLIYISITLGFSNIGAQIGWNWGIAAGHTGGSSIITLMMGIAGLIIGCGIGLGISAAITHKK